MKKKIRNLICALGIGVIALNTGFVTACSGSGSTDIQHIHIDCNWNGICDTCGSPIDEASYVPEKPSVEKPDPEKPNPEKPDPEKPDPEKPDPEKPIKPVAKITVKNAPGKTEYFVDDSFEPEGGLLTVNYTDRTSEEVAFTASGVTFSNTDFSKEGSKTVSVSYGGKKANFVVNVVKVGGLVTFDMNYEGDTDLVVKVGVGRAVTRPENPVRNSYEFFDWYTDKDCTVAYKFDSSKIITEDVTIYAAWKGEQDSVVTYDLNYYGVAIDKFSQIVEAGKAARPIADPVRNQFEFAGWYTDENLTDKYVTGTAISSDTTLRAKWQRVSRESKTYTFEAENTDLAGKVGPGFSGELIGADMIVSDVVGADNISASGGRYVSSLYQKGLGLEFYIACSEAVSDASISVYLTLDPALSITDMTLTSTQYQVIINGQVQSFAAFTVKHEAFSEKIKLDGVALKEGANTIQLLTNNSDHPFGVAGGGTYKGSAPVVDCIKITTAAVLEWDENYGLPANKV